MGGGFRALGLEIGVSGLGFGVSGLVFRAIIPRIENQMEKKMEHERDTGLLRDSGLEIGVHGSCSKYP